MHRVWSLLFCLFAVVVWKNNEEIGLVENRKKEEEGGGPESFCVAHDDPKKDIGPFGTRPPKSGGVQRGQKGEQGERLEEHPFLSLTSSC